MIHLLIIAEENVRLPPITAPSPAIELKVLRKPNLTAARPLLETGVFDVCLLGVDELGEDAHWLIAEFRTAAPHCPLIVAPQRGSPEDERAAYLAGADLVLAPSSDQATMLAVVRRLAARSAGASSAASQRASASPFLLAGVTPAALATSALAVMRDFSQVFSYSLDYKQFTGHFVVKLREIIGVARIAIFLEPPPPAASLGIATAHDPQRLICAGAVGLPADLIECFELSRKSGLGQRIAQTGRILHLGAESTAPFVAEDPRIQREFEILGCEVALPVNDRERTIGVALLGGRLTGAPFSESELLLVYHLMEELGLAVKNSWLHHQLSASHRLFSDVLGAMTSGALVVGSDLAVVFANQALLRALKGEAGVAARLDFADLPPPLAKSLHDVVERGQSLAPFLYEHPGPPARAFRASLIPFPNLGRQLPQPALLLLEDFTQVRAAQRAEIEASNLKLIGLIARRFAHEIRNSLVPLTTHQQFFDTDYANTDFRDSLKQALSRETSRIQRFTEQMVFLAQTEQGPTDTLPLEELLRKSFARSREFLGATVGELEIRSEVADPLVRCHRPSLAHALQEIFLNGLQSAGAPPRVTVTVAAERGADGRSGFALKVRDNGRGFTPEVAARATDPFFTTRNTGVGLGLTVAKRVIEAHAGRLEVHARGEPNDPDLVIHLPANP
ncbi:MAG TPA: ATP-binding protein [Opitutaceae bacterium]|nr:ATP-binding protein [Opitutaceae bacterium]